MKKGILLFTLAGTIGYIALTASSSGGAWNSGVDGTGATGPGGCNCHSSSTLVTATVELDSAGVPVTGYLPGHSYTLKISGTNGTTSSLPKFGFQVTVVKSAGAGSGSTVNAGTLGTTGLPTGTRYTSNASSGIGIDVIEQSSARPATTGTGATGTTYVMGNLPWTAPATGTGTVKIYGVINAVNGTGGSGGDKWNYATVATITEMLPPSVAPITGTDTVCVGATTTLADATTGGTWSSVTTSVATITTAGVVTGVSAGTSVISYTTGSGTATKTVVVLAPPSIPTLSGHNFVCLGTIDHTDTLTGIPAGGTWTSSNSLDPITAGGVLTGGVAGFDTVTYTYSNGCGTPVTANMTIHVLTVTQCDSVLNVNTICTVNGGILNIYPNPSNGNITVVIPEINSNSQISVVDIYGKTIETMEVKYVFDNKVEMNLNNLATGTYFIKLNSNNVTYHGKVMIVNR